MAELPFFVDVYGLFGPDQVRIVYRDEPAPAIPALEAMVADAWAKQTELARQRGFHLYNGQIVRLLRYRVHNGFFMMEGGPSDFAHFIGTNYLNYHRANEFGWTAFSNPIGVSGILVTDDGWILYGRRNHRVACHPGYVQAFGGSLEIGERRADDTFDAFACILRELDEEAGVQEVDVAETACLGMARDRQIRQPELVFDVKIRQRREEMLDRLRHDDAEQEHAEIVACQDTPEAIVPFIRRMVPMSPVAIGALFLHGRRHFGDRWYEQAAQDLCQPQ
ncbi:MAG: NUDIX hydrolase [Phycisphaerae bacterium]